MKRLMVLLLASLALAACGTHEPIGRQVENNGDGPKNFLEYRMRESLESHEAGRGENAGLILCHKTVELIARLTIPR